MTARGRALAIWLGFQIVWIACALGAARGTAVPGIMAGFVFVAWVLRTEAWGVRSCFAVGLSGLIGLVGETALLRLGLIDYAAPWPSHGLAPAWIVTLWLAFGATARELSAALDAWFGRHALLAATALGTCLGPAAYWAGARLGALAFTGSRPATDLAIAALWGLAMPLLMTIPRRPDP